MSSNLPAEIKRGFQLRPRHSMGSRFLSELPARLVLRVFANALRTSVVLIVLVGVCSEIGMAQPEIAPGQLTESGLQGECIARSDVGIAVDWTLLRPTASSERSLVLELFAKLLPGIVYEEDQVRLYLILGENVPPNPTLSEGQLQIVAGEFIPGPGREVYCDIERRPMEAKNLLEMFNTAGQEPVFGSLEAQILDLLTLVYVPRIVRVESEDECEYEVISATLVPQSVFEGSQPDENLDTASPLPLGGLDSLPVPPSLLGTRQLTLSETRSRLEDLLAGQWIPRVQSRQRCEDGTIADAYSGEQVTTLLNSIADVLDQDVAWYQRYFPNMNLGPVSEAFWTDVVTRMTQIASADSTNLPKSPSPPAPVGGAQGTPTGTETRP